MADFLTPGRRVRRGGADGGGLSSSKRVVRSALEVLLDTASPGVEVQRPPRTTSAPAAASSSSRFTVSYAGTGSSLSPREGSRRRTVEDGEPSALLFLSPHDKGGGSQERATGSSPSTRRALSLFASGASPPVPPQTSRSLIADVEQAEEGSPEASDPSRRGEGSVLQEDVALFTLQDVQDRIQSAIIRYEKQRDAEETQVLQELSEEIDKKDSLYAHLLEEKDEVEKVNGELQAKLTAVVEQCETMQLMQQEALSEKHMNFERAKQLEVELCHCKDALRTFNAARSTTLEDRQTQEENEAALRSALKAKTEEAAELQAQCDAYRAEVEHLEGARAQYLEECGDIKSSMSRFNQNMIDMESALRAKDHALETLRRKLADAEKASVSLHSEEREKLLQKQRELEASLQHQTDEVRRRMHRVTTLTEENKNTQSVLQLLYRTMMLTAERQEALRKMLTNAVRDVRGKVNDTPKGKNNQPSISRRVRAEDTLVFDEDDSELSSSLLSGDELLELQRSQGRHSTSPMRGRRTPSPSAAPRGAAVTSDMVERVAKEIRQITSNCADAIRHINRIANTLAERARVSTQQCVEQLASQATSSDQSKRLQEACRYLKEKLTASEDELCACRKECDLQRADLQTMSGELSAAREVALRSETETASLRTANAVLMKNKVSLEAELTASRKDVESIAAESSSVGTRHKVLLAEHNDALQKLEQLSQLAQKYADTQLTLHKEQLKSSKLCDRLKLAEEERSKFENENRQLKEKANHLATQLGAKRSQDAAARYRDTKEAQASAAEVTRLRDALASASALHEAYRAEVARDSVLAGEGSARAEKAMKALQSKVRQQRERIEEMARESDARAKEEVATLQTLIGLLSDFSGDTQEDVPRSISIGHAAASSVTITPPRQPRGLGGGSAVVVAHAPHNGEEDVVMIRRRVIAALQRTLVLSARLKQEAAALSPAPRPPYPSEEVPAHQHHEGSISSPGGAQPNRELYPSRPTSCDRQIKNPSKILSHPPVFNRIGFCGSECSAFSSSPAPLTRSHSRGEVDGSCDPARPPVLRSLSLRR